MEINADLHMADKNCLTKSLPAKNTNKRNVCHSLKLDTAAMDHDATSNMKRKMSKKLAEAATLSHSAK